MSWGDTIIGPEDEMAALEMAARMRGVWHEGLHSVRVWGPNHHLIQRVSAYEPARQNFDELARIASKFEKLQVTRIK